MLVRSLVFKPKDGMKCSNKDKRMLEK